MPVISAITTPKGSQGMTLFGTRNDDTTVTLPDIGFNFFYNGSAIRQLYTSGNTWIGFGTGSEQLSINRRDASYNNLYYLKEVEYGINCFRVRFEGNSSYGSWGANDLIWEFTIFESGVMRLVIDKIPNNGTNSFINPGIGTQALTLAANKSYIFIPSDLTGKSYVIQEGTYIPCTSKYLMVDSEGVKAYQTANGTSRWNKVGDLPLTEEMFKAYGIELVPQSLEGLVDNSPTLYHYTDNTETKANKQNYILEVLETVTSKPKLIVQNVDFNIHANKTINRIEITYSNTKKDASLNDVSTNGKLRLALSFDSGGSYKTYNQATSRYEDININDTASFLAGGINPANILNIDYSALNTALSSNKKLRLAYIIEKSSLVDVCKLKKIKIVYN